MYSRDPKAGQVESHLHEAAPRSSAGVEGGQPHKWCYGHGARLCEVRSPPATGETEVDVAGCVGHVERDSPYQW